MTTLILDIENTISFPYDDAPSERDGSPYNHNNALVCVGYKVLETGEKDVLVFHHNEFTGSLVSNSKYLERLLSEATTVVGHNLKHDLSWLFECGHDYDGKLHDTMIFEYVFMKGMKRDLSLDACADRRGVQESKLDLLKEYLKVSRDDNRLNVNEIPLDKLIEYNLQDVEVTEKLYLAQLKYVDTHREKHKHTLVDTDKLYSVCELMTDFLRVLIDMESAGTTVDMSTLDQYELAFTKELQELDVELRRKIEEYMGDTPFNFNSNDDMAKLLYSRLPVDKKKWCEVFNIGTDQRGSVRKKKNVKILARDRFDHYVKDMEIAYKTKAKQCTNCRGVGKIQKYTKKNEPYKNMNICPVCNGAGLTHTKLSQVAGLKLRPNNRFASNSGFATSKHVIEYYLGKHSIPKEVKEFLSKLDRRNKLDTWVNTFCKAIRKYTKSDGRIHTSFNQCIAATGRLSSTKPNLQNQSKRDKDFPIRKVFTTRWKEGWLIDADFGQLEFRIAAYLSQCPAAMKAIEEGLDIHSLTRDFYHGKLQYQPDVLVPEMTRQEAKAETFGPLYGKITAWTKQFYALFPGIKEWHETIMGEAATWKQVQTPSGRVYSFPTAEWFTNRAGDLLVSGHTQIKNYGVQGFATGDVVAIVCIDIWKYLRQHKAKSKLILQVHDSATTDTHPDEKDLVLAAYQYAFNNVYSHARERWGIDLNVPLSFELSIGKNWLEQEEIKLN